MKKEEIKSALSKIEPSEELIQKTLLKIKEQKNTEKKSRLSFINGFNYKYVGAFCAAALVLCVGVAAFGNGGINRGQQPGISSRNGQNTEVTGNTGIDVVAFSLDDLEHESAAVVKGTLSACYMSVDKENQTEGIIASGALEIAVDNVEEDAGYALLKEASGSTLSAIVHFSSQEEINTLVSLMSEDVYFSLIPEKADGEAVWKVIDFSINRPE